jgi:uncharacterized protein (TIGR03066 family)
MLQKATYRLLAVFVVLSFLVTSCGGGGSSIVGKWHTDESGGMDWEFTKDGKIKLMIASLMTEALDAGTYTVSGDKITLNISMLGQEETQTGTFKIDGDKLTLTDSSGEALTFTKVK